MTQSWVMLRVTCAMAAIASSAHAANMKEVFQLMHQQQMLQTQEGHAMEHPRQDKLPTQPIHRSILSHRKRTILREKHASVGSSMKGNIVNPNTNDSGVSQDSLSLRVAKGRRTNEESNEMHEDVSSHNENEEEESHDENSSPEEPIPALLTSPFWVKIHEEYGENVYNFVPGSRRAASSVVFTYKYDNGRLLGEEDGGVEADSSEANNAIDVLEQEAVSVIETESTSEEVAIQSESKKENATTESLEQESDVITNSTESTSGVVGDKEDAATSESEEQADDSSTTSTEEEYMIISGGYTDRDWKTFPVYAFPLTASVRTLSGQWIDLSPSELDHNAESQCNEEDGSAAREKLYQEAVFLDTNDKNSTIDEDPWEHAAPCAPSGRMGHQSVIHDGKLYVFGGLIYDEEQAPGGYGRKETFRLEDVPFTYRLDLKEMFEARQAERKGGGRSMQEVTRWQRIIPRVKPFSTPNGMSSTSAAEVLLAFVNRGEMQGGLWSSESSGDNDKFVMYGGLRIAKLDFEGYGHNAPSKYVKGGSTFGGSSSQMHSHKIVELPLGDVWAYDLVLDCWEKITNNYGRVRCSVFGV